MIFLLGKESVFFTVAVAVICVLSGSSAQAQTKPLTQVPFNSIAVGVPDTTFNGTGQKSCAPSTPGYLDTEGDGCVPTQAVLNYPYGVSIDKSNNVYIAEYGTNFIRVVYQSGTALAAALVAGNPSYTFTPTAGHIYGFGGSTAALTASKTTGLFYCTGTSGPTALDSGGDGCPAQSGYMKPRNVAVDKDGNIFIAGVSPYQGVRVIYVGGTTVSNLIKAYDSTITPQAGYIYALSASGDFVAIRDIAIDASENIYAIDNGAAATAKGLQATTTGNQIKKFSGTGWTTYLAGSTSAAPAAANGDGGIATSATIYANGSSAEVFFDPNGNLYILDGGNNRIRLVYSSGPTPPLYVEGSNATVVTNPIAGYIYTVAGGGTGTGTGALASALSLGTTTVNGTGVAPTAGPLSFGSDAAANLYFTDTSKNLWREDVRTGIAVIIGGYGATSYNATTTATYTASTAPATGVACNGATGGPLMTDADGGGCPATEVAAYGPSGRISFDTNGQFYQTEQRVSAQPDGIVRRYSYTNSFPATAVGTSASTSLAYTPTSATTYTPAVSYVLTGTSTTEFTDAGSNLCSVSGPASVQTCVYNAIFTPALPGRGLAQ